MSKVGSFWEYWYGRLKVDKKEPDVITGLFFYKRMRINGLMNI